LKYSTKKVGNWAAPLGLGVLCLPYPGETHRGAGPGEDEEYIGPFPQPGGGHGEGLGVL